MRSTAKWVGLVLITALVLGTVLFSVAKFFTAERRDEAIAQAQAVIAECRVAPDKHAVSNRAATPKTPAKTDDTAEAPALFAHLEKLDQSLRKSDSKDFSSFELSEFWKDKHSKEFACAAACLGKAQELLIGIRRFSVLEGPFLKAYARDPKVLRVHWVALRELLYWLSSDARLALADGTTPVFVDDITSMDRLVSAFADTSSQFASVAFTAYFPEVFWILRDAVNTQRMKAGTVDSIITTLPTADVRSVLRNALARNYAGILAYYDGLRTGTTTQQYLESQQAILSQFPKLSQFTKIRLSLFTHLYVSPLGAPWRDLEERQQVEWYTQAIKDSMRPYYETHLGQDTESARPVKLSNPGLFWFRELTAAEAEINLTRIGLLLEVYRDQNGRYPESLDAIKPKLGGALPVDPFSGASYVYRKTHSGLVLYSVGRNGRDDGGISDDLSGRGDHDDIVWRIGR